MQKAENGDVEQSRKRRKTSTDGDDMEGCDEGQNHSPAPALCTKGITTPIDQKPQSVSAEEMMRTLVQKLGECALMQLDQDQ